MVQLIQKQKAIIFAASFAAAIMTITPAPAQAGPQQQGNITSEGLEHRAPNWTHKGRSYSLIEHRNILKTGSTFRPATLVTAIRNMATVARAGLQPPALDKMTTGTVPRAVFRSVTLPIRNLPAAAQWRPINAQLGQALTSECNGSDCQARASRLETAIDKASSARFMEKLRLINLTVNKMIDYTSDHEIYGRLDYWATPSQTLQAGRGDCEDYAILKMAALKRAGIPLSSMSLVVLRDRKRNLFHAVLAVTTNQGHFILDNAHDAVLLDSQIARYQPLYSMSGERYWLHGTRRSGDPVVATGNASLRNVAPGEGADALAIAAPLLR